MTIDTQDVRLLKSQRLTDEDDGGGRATGLSVADGEMNNLFPDLSRMDRTTGRINMRKVYAGVQTDNDDPYLGAHAIVTEAPADPRVSVVLFNTDSQTDERADARRAIESYVVPSAQGTFELLGDQLTGQRAIVCVQGEEQRLPEVGEVYQLVSKQANQYVRIVDVESSLEQFVYDYSNGNFVTFTKRRLNLKLSQPLLYKFPGGQPRPGTTTDSNLEGESKTRVLATQVADAARYYGISPLAAACAVGDMSLRLNSVYAQLVPSTKKETALVDQIGGPRRRWTQHSGAQRTVALSFAAVENGRSRSYLTTGAQAGTVQLTLGNTRWVESGTGEFRAQGASGSLSRVTLNYETGEINTYGSSPFTGGGSATYFPAAAVSGQAVTGEIAIKLGNRGFAYTLDLSEAKPRPGTLTVDYMSLGRWYQLVDNGAGELVGEGSGTVQFGTGSVSLTLGALPDVGSSILYGYVDATDSNFHWHPGSANPPTATLKHTLEHAGIRPGSVTISVLLMNAWKTLSDDGHGVLSGDAGRGAIRYASGQVELTLASTPDANSRIKIEYEQGTPVDTAFAPLPDAAGVVIGTLPGAPLKPGSIRLAWQCMRQQRTRPLNDDLLSYTGTTAVGHEVVDDGNGGWADGVGSINYATGAFSLQVEGDYDYPEYFIAYKKDELDRKKPVTRTVQVRKRETFAGTLAVRAQSAGETYGPQSESVAAPALVWDLLPDWEDPIVPGSLILDWNGATIVDRDGVLFRNVSTQTNAGTAIGTVDYASGVATISSYEAAAGTRIERLGCLTTKTGFTTTQAFWRTPGAPLRPASLQISAVRADTAQIVTATADLNGVIKGEVIHGSVDAQTGIVRVAFTRDPEDSSGASDVPVIGSLIRYNAVLQSNLPMDADLLGLDPVRLPADGRVPIFREGDVVVIHHSQETVVASPRPGETLPLGRDALAAIDVRDARGVALAAAQFTADRERGTVTWANPLLLQGEDGSALTLPLTITDRREHMTQVTEVQITGTLSIGSPLPWALPAERAYVSSAIRWGDLQARLYRWFTQKSWNTSAPNWTDRAEGEVTTANYNQLSYPPLITNRGAIGGRWALVFTSPTAFNVVEERLGVVSTGTTSQDCAPINPETKAPWFTIRWQGWGAGWAAGNAVRFNTDPCLGPLWVVRTCTGGRGAVQEDAFTIQIRGDAD